MSLMDSGLCAVACFIGRCFGVSFPDVHDLCLGMLCHDMRC